MAQVHGYASRVLFRQACGAIPRDAVCLEVGPHALLRSPLRQNRQVLWNSLQAHNWGQTQAQACFAHQATCALNDACTVAVDPR